MNEMDGLTAFQQECALFFLWGEIRARLETDSPVTRDWLIDAIRIAVEHQKKESA